MSNKFKHAIVLHLQNTQSSYASAARFIDGFEKNKYTISDTRLNALRDQSGLDIYWFNNRQISYNNLFIEDILKPENEILKQRNSQDIIHSIKYSGNAYKYVFIVKLDMSAEDYQYNENEDIDIVNLQYLLTVWQNYAGKLYIYLDNDAPDKAFVKRSYHKISQYLFLASFRGCKISNKPDQSGRFWIEHKDDAFYNAVFACYYSKKINSQVEKKYIQHLQLRGMAIEKMTKYIPILHIDKQSRDFLSMSVGEIFPSEWEYKKIINRLKSDTGTNINAILNEGGELPSDEKIFEYALQSVCWNYLFKDINSKFVSESEGTAICNELSIFIGMSMLSFYIYCIFAYFSRQTSLQNRSIMNREKKLKLISDVQDYASGIFELIDNAVRHSSKKSGFLGIRIHSYLDNGKMKWLMERYPLYFENKGTLEEYYLEVCITDSYQAEQKYRNFSECIMIEKFIENLEKRIGEYPEDKIPIIEQFKKKFINAQIRDFFNPISQDDNNNFSIEDWDSYYAITSNMLYHYGLMQFSAIVKGRKGYFRVRSSKDYTFSEKCSYSTAEDKDLNAIKNVYLPGTQYSIILPIRLKAEQYITGLSIPASEIDFGILRRLEQVDCTMCSKSDLDYILKNYKSNVNGINVIPNASRDVYEKLKRFGMEGGLSVYCFNMEQYSYNNVEVFMRGLFFFISETAITRNNENILRIVLYNCSFVTLLHCVELLSVCYNRYAEQEAMRYVSVYLVDKDCREDFLIAGKNLKNAIALSEKMSLSKGRFSLPHAIFSAKIWNRNFSDRSTLLGSQELETSAQYVPYDLFVKIDDDKTVFEKAVEETLNEDIQESDLGCRIRGSHVRVGSKIHVIGDFYEAQELFHSPHYLLRFAYLIALKIKSEIINKEITRDNKVVLIGYETYSELLIINIERC